MFVRGVIIHDDVPSKFFGTFFSSPGENLDIPDAGTRSTFSEQCRRRQCERTAWWCRGVDNRSHAFDITNPNGTSGWVRSSAMKLPLFSSTHKNTEFPGDLDTAYK